MAMAKKDELDAAILRAERDEAIEKLGECHAGYETLRKELAAAREALEPFAKAAERIVTSHLSGHVSDDEECLIKAGDLFRARAALGNLRKQA